jgi:hypothetical protein
MKNTNPHDGLPPFVKSWRQMYFFVVGSLVFVMVALYVFMKYFE